MEHTKHLWRAGLLLLLLPIIYIVARHFLVPESFGAFGFYRGNAVQDWMSEPIFHGDTTECLPCHKAEYEAHGAGKHAAVSCHTCHSPIVKHVDGEEKVGELPVLRTYTLCARCHEKLIARPKDFPQVDIKEHLKEEEAELTEAVCLECHESHAPE
ncbi:MAG: cytochrome C [Planctomycetota bacterium]|jgi:formate-dependent nitrite reductase cytochrome c552 subunit